MRRMIWSVVLACTAVPGTAWSMTPVSSVHAVQPSQAEDLEMMANFFLPGPPLLKTVHEVCGENFRAQLATQADLVQLDAKLPGLFDRMAATAVAHCDTETAAMVARWHAKIKADWTTEVSAADLARLAKLVATATGEAMGSARLDGTVPADWDARWHAAQQEFARTPGGAALLAKLGAYQKRVSDQLSSDDGELSGIIREGFAKARRAANAYAREKGFAPPFTDG